LEGNPGSCWWQVPGSRVFKEGKGGYVVRFFAGRLQQIKIIEEIGE
jgi:hypothetical protein